MWLMRPHQRLGGVTRVRAPGYAPRMGEAAATFKSQHRRAMDAPPPGAGRIIRTSLPDTFDGIRFEIGRMAKYVAEARRDPVVIDAARQAASQWAKIVERLSEQEGNPINVHNNKTIALEGIDVWCRNHCVYQSDPAGIELIQPARRMIKTAQLPRAVLEPFMEPFYRALERDDPAFNRASMPPAQVCSTDCDECSILVCSMAAAIDITPVAFAFGGDGGTLHHTWARVMADGVWYDSDITEPSYQLGEKSGFDHEEEYVVPL